MPRGRRTLTQEWAAFQAQCLWPEQALYELVRPVVLLKQPVKQRAKETGVSAKTIAQRANQFIQLGFPGFHSTAGPRPDDARLLPPVIRDFLLTRKAEYPTRKAEYPALTDAELATLCAMQFGRTVGYRTVARIVRRSLLPVGVERRYPRASEQPDAEQRRLAIIHLHVEGWKIKRIAEYLGVSRQTVHTTLRRWIEEGVAGLADKSHARTAPRKATFPVMDKIRALQENPGLGAFRMHAALKQLGITVSPATCGRIMALNRQLYDLSKPTPAPKPKKLMPFAAVRRHEFWSVDICYIEHHHVPEYAGQPIYIFTILDNYSRAIVASAPSPTQNLDAFLLVLFTAIHVHGAPEALVSDGGSVFKANFAFEIYEQLGIRKEQIERRRPWQNYVETHFALMKRLEAYDLAKATSWEQFCATHAKFVADYNWQEHFAHQDRDDGLRSPSEVLGWVHGRFVELPTLDQIFHARHASRHLNQRGYIRYLNWRLYGEEGLAGEEACVWLFKETLTIAFAEEPIAQYEVNYAIDGHTPEQITELRPIPSTHPSPQLPLWENQQVEWHKVKKLLPYAPRRSARSSGYRQSRLFA